MESNIQKPEGLRALADAYGIAVRSGVLTPCIDDEIAIRKAFGLPGINEAVKNDWKKSDGVRRPITLSKDDDSPAKSTGDEKENE